MELFHDSILYNLFLYIDSFCLFWKIRDSMVGLRNWWNFNENFDFVWNADFDGYLTVAGAITGSGNISGSYTSTGSFGNVNVQEMSIPSVSAFSSSIATKLDTLEADIIALSIALG